MKKKDFHVTITVNVSAGEAMKKISQVDRWWAKKFTGKAEKAGDEFTANFGETFVDFRISEFIPGKKIVWKVTNCNLHWIANKKEWNNTEVVFDVTEKKKNQAKIDFTHVGLVPGIECYKDCEAGWSEHIEKSLAAFIQEGKGMPV